MTTEVVPADLSSYSRQVFSSSRRQRKGLQMWCVDRETSKVISERLQGQVRPHIQVYHTLHQEWPGHVPHEGCAQQGPIGFLLSAHQNRAGKGVSHLVAGAPQRQNVQGAINMTTLLQAWVGGVLGRQWGAPFPSLWKTKQNSIQSLLALECPVHRNSRLCQIG